MRLILVPVLLLVGAAAAGCEAKSHARDAEVMPDGQVHDAQVMVDAAVRDGSAPDAGMSDASQPQTSDGSTPRDMDAGRLQDAGAPIVLADEHLIAPGCKQLGTIPEPPQLLDFRLVLCGDAVERLELPSGKLTLLAAVKSEPRQVWLTPDHALLQLQDEQLTSISLDSGGAVALSPGMPIGFTHDQARVITRHEGSIYAQRTDGGDLPLQLCAAADLWSMDARGTHVICNTASSFTTQSVDLESGAALDLLTTNLPSLLDEPIEQLAVLDMPSRKLRVLSTDGSRQAEWSFGERDLDKLVAFTRDGKSLIVSAGEHLWSVLISDGSFHALSDRPTGENLNLRVAPHALIFETSPRTSHFSVSAVTLSAVPLNGSALVTLGEISDEYWTDLQWDRPVAYASDMRAALYPTYSPQGWSLTDFETLTTTELPLDVFKSTRVAPRDFYGLSDDLAAYPDCPRSSLLGCVLVVADRAGKVLTHVSTQQGPDDVYFAPTADYILVRHDDVLELATRGDVSQRFQVAKDSSNVYVYPLASWFGSRAFLYTDSHGAHLVQLRN